MKTGDTDLRTILLLSRELLKAFLVQLLGFYKTVISLLIFLTLKQLTQINNTYQKLGFSRLKINYFFKG